MNTTIHEITDGGETTTVGTVTVSNGRPQYTAGTPDWFIERTQDGVQLGEAGTIPPERPSAFLKALAWAYKGARFFCRFNP